MKTKSPVGKADLPQSQRGNNHRLIGAFGISINIY